MEEEEKEIKKKFEEEENKEEDIKTRIKIGKILEGWERQMI